MFWLLFIIFIPAKQIYVFSLFSCHWLKVLKNRWQGFFSIFLQVVRTTFLFVKRFCIIHYYMACRSGKKIFFCAWNIFLIQHHLVFVDMKYFFCTKSTSFADMKHFFSTLNYFLCNVKLFVFNTKLFFV